MSSSVPPQRNRIVRYDSFSRQIEIWHEDDRGDERDFVFELPRGVRRSHVETAFREKGRRWIDWLAEQGMEVNAETIRCHGPYPCVELDKLDMMQFVISARVRRSRPLVMKTLDAEKFFGEREPVLPIEQFLGQVNRVPKERIEQNARAEQEARQRQPEAQAAWEQMQRERRERGLPEFKGA